MGDDSTKLAALDEIVEIITDYMPPDSGITPLECVSRIISAIETRNVTQFVTMIQYVNEPEPIPAEEGERIGKGWPALVPGEEQATEWVTMLRRALGDSLKPDTPYDRLYDAVAAIAIENNIRERHGGRKPQ